MFLGKDELHLLWGLICEKGSYPVCFSADFVLLIKTPFAKLRMLSRGYSGSSEGSAQKGTSAYHVG